MVIKKKLMQIGGLVIAMAALMNFTSCLRALNKTNAGDIERLLQEKYGIKFQVISIGNRLASPSMDTVTAYCSPKNNNRVVFEAKMNVASELVSDDFIERYIDVQAEEQLEIFFQNFGMETTVKVDIYPIPDAIDYQSANYKQVLQSSSDISFTFTTVLRETNGDRKMYDALQALFMEYYEINNRIPMGTTIWHIKQETYEDCSKEMRRKPFPSKTFYENYSPLGSAIVSSQKGIPNISYKEFHDQLFSN